MKHFREDYKENSHQPFTNPIDGIDLSTPPALRKWRNFMADLHLDKSDGRVSGIKTTVVLGSVLLLVFFFAGYHYENTHPIGSPDTYADKTAHHKDKHKEHHIKTTTDKKAVTIKRVPVDKYNMPVQLNKGKVKQFFGLKRTNHHAAYFVKLHAILVTRLVKCQRIIAHAKKENNSSTKSTVKYYKQYMQFIRKQFLQTYPQAAKQSYSELLNKMESNPGNHSQVINTQNQ